MSKLFFLLNSPAQTPTVQVNINLYMVIDPSGYFPFHVFKVTRGLFEVLEDSDSYGL
jgi:hypothetical protein